MQVKNSPAHNQSPKYQETKYQDISCGRSTNFVGRSLKRPFFNDCKNTDTKEEQIRDEIHQYSSLIQESGKKVLKNKVKNKLSDKNIENDMRVQRSSTINISQNIADFKEDKNDSKNKKNYQKSLSQM